MTMDLTRTPELIAGEINTIKEQVRSTALIASVEIGKRLQEAKGLVPVGQWTAWLRDHVAYSERTAQGLMGLASEFAAGHAQALENLSLTKAVMLLSLPHEEREEFIETHPVEDMSTRELRQALNALKEKNAELQISMDQLLRERDESGVDQMRQEIDGLHAELSEARTAVETAKDVNRSAREDVKRLRASLTETKAQLRQAEEAAQKERAELQQALRDAQQPVIQQVTPPDVEKELADLRARLQRSQEEQAVRAGYELLTSSYARLSRQLSDLHGRDPALAEEFRAAFAKALRLMADGLEGKEAVA